MRILRALGYALAIAAAAGAHARPQDPPEPPEPPEPPAAAAFAVGPAYVFGTHNTLTTVLILDPAGTRLCSPDLSHCRPAYGADPLFRSQQMQVAQLLKWDRSGVFGLNGTEMIACFLYFDGPGGAYFSCQTAARPSTTSNYMLSQALTTLAWSAYNGAGLQPQSAARQSALYDKRKATTAYALANGTLPPERMRPQATEDDPVPTQLPTDPPPPVYEFELVQVTGTKSPETPPPPAPPPNVVTLPNLTITLPPQARTPAIIVDGCVSFQICSEPPPPPPPPLPPAPPKVCQPQCNVAHAAMAATCSTGAAQVGAAVAIVVPTGSLVASFVGTPALGVTFFKTGGLAGGTILSAWVGGCKALNDSSLQQCIARAKQKGC